MKKKLLLPLFALVSTVLFSCGETTSTPLPSQGSNPPVTTTTTIPSINPSVTNSSPEEESYTIRVTAPTGVDYSIDKQKAKKGETVTLTITSLSPGYTIKRITLNSSTELKGSNNVYTFTMPNRSASINIEVNVDGDVTLVGQIAANLVLDPETGIYVARNVKVDNPARKVYFSYQIKKDGNAVILDSTDLDETKCFADITFAYGNDEGELEIASGCSYDFFYNPASQYPCYVQRVSVDVLPTTVTSLYSLFDGSMRSDTACHEVGLTGIDYTITDLQGSTPLMMNYSYREHANNISFATATDVLTNKKYYVYKEYNEQEKLYTVVDTYTKALGNDDLFRMEYNNHGAHSAKLDVVDLDDDNNTRFQISKRKALRNLNNPAHHGYNLERDFMDAYRVGFSADELSSSNINIASTKTDTGFDTTITSYTEYNSNEGAYTSEMHEAYQYAVEMSFNEAGGITSLSYEKVKFTKTEWDFSSHKPQIGQEGRVVKQVSSTHHYNNVINEAPDFDKNKYFIASFDELRFYNSKTNMPADDNKSYVHYNDKIRLTKADENTPLNNLNKLTYSPSTALDLWQYSPTSSTDESIIAKLPSDRYDQMTACGIGTATVTISNHTVSSGIKKDVEINVTATQKFHSMYLNSGGDPVTTSYSANIVAGQVGRFQVGVTPSTAPVVFTATVDPNYIDYLKVVSTTGGYLVLDASGAKDIVEPVEVKVRLDSEWFDPACTNKYAMFTFTIIPQDISPVGTWQMDGTTALDPVIMTFTEEDYTDRVSSGFEGAKKGQITDTIDGITDTFKFYYVFKNGTLSAKIYDVDIKSSTEFSSDPYNYVIDFYYDATSGKYGVCLFEAVYEEYYEDFYCYPIYGEVSSDGEIISYYGFTKVE